MSARRFLQGMATLAAFLLLSACGGGGGDAPNSATQALGADQPARSSALNLAGLSLYGRGSTSARVAVPISAHRSSFGYMYMTVPVTIGSTTIEAILDTGSPGLRVLPGALQAYDYTQRETPSEITYSSGERVVGRVATGVVKVGAASTGVGIDFTLADEVVCDVSKPTCGAQGADAQTYGFLQERSDGATGYKAILGVSLRGPIGHPFGSDGVFSPLAQMGRSSFVVQITHERGVGTGWLIINPDARDDGGWVRFDLKRQSAALALGVSTWYDQSLYGCLIDQSNQRQQCSPLMLDTGSPSMTLFSKNIRGDGVAPAGTLFSWTLKQDSFHSLYGPLFGSVYQDADIGNASVVFTRPLETPFDEDYMVWGPLVFYQYNVLFSSAGFIALRPH
jgi:hypothetical protein